MALYSALSPIVSAMVRGPLTVEALQELVLKNAIDKLTEPLMGKLYTGFDLMDAMEQVSNVWKTVNGRFSKSYKSSSNTGQDKCGEEDVSYSSDKEIEDPDEKVNLVNPIIIVFYVSQCQICNFLISVILNIFIICQ